MKKLTPKARTTAIRVRIKPSVKAMAERLAQKDVRSLADWIERLIADEKARRAGKNKRSHGARRSPVKLIVMAGLVPAMHVFASRGQMPGMTKERFPLKPTLANNKNARYYRM